MTKYIPNTFGYMASTDGKIYSTKREHTVYSRTKLVKYRKKELQQNPDTNGYLLVGVVFLENEERVFKTKTVHRLVAMTFLDNPENKPQVNHKDGDKTNNNVSNLEWATVSENVRHAYSIQLMKGKPGENNSMAKLSEIECENLIKDILDGYTNNELSKKYLLHSRYISLIRHKKRWKELWNTKFKGSTPPTSKGKKLSSRLDDGIKEKILIDIRNGEYLTKLEKKYNISRATLTRVRKANGWNY